MTMHDSNWTYRLPEPLMEQLRDIHRQAVDEAEKAQALQEQIAPLQEELLMHIRRAMMIKNSVWPKIFEAAPEVSDVNCATDKPLNLNFETGEVTISAEDHDCGPMGLLQRLFGSGGPGGPGGAPAS